MKRYFDIEILKDVYLEDSYILDIDDTNSNYFEMKLELVLKESHPLYSTPLKEEQYCYVDALISFFNIRSVKWNEKNINNSQLKKVEGDYGNVDSFLIDQNKIKIFGEIGNVEILIERDSIIEVKYFLSKHKIYVESIFIR